jgi:hypothetical protein
MDEPLNKINKSDFSRRKVELLLKKYTDRLPVIISSSSIKIKNKESRFIVPSDMTISQFMIILRQKISLGSTEAIFIFIKSPNNKLASETNPVSLSDSEKTNDAKFVSGKDIMVSPTSSIITLYNQYKDENLVLNLYFEKENVFG